MMLPARWILPVVLVFAAGCASSSAPAKTPATRPASRPAPTKARLALDEIKPAPVFPSPITIARSVPSRPPLEAIELYARGRSELHAHKRFNAIHTLERAVQIDPYSFELYWLLGKARLGGDASNDDALEAFHRAAAIRPDSLAVQVELGRQYFAQENFPLAIHHLRLALQTEEYRTDEANAAVVDFFLSRALQESGYDRAALDQYEILLHRLAEPTLAMRSNADIAYLAGRPELLYMQIGGLYEKNGRHAQALEAFELAAAEDATNIVLQSRPVRALLSLERYEEAQHRAAAIVRTFRANKESLELLRETYRAQGRESAAVDELTRLSAENPHDRGLLFALADALRSNGRQTDAEQVLDDAARRYPDDFQIVQRLFNLQQSRGDNLAAAALLTEALGRRPQMIAELGELWGRLLRPARGTRVRIPDLQALEVSPEAQAAKLYWVSRLADLWNRDSLAHSSLAQAVRHQPPFPPAYRMLVTRIWHKPDLEETDKAARVEALAGDLESQGHVSLAAELRGLNALNQNDPDEASRRFTEAIRTGGDSPELHLAQVAVLKLQGQSSRAEQLLWKIISDFPAAEDAYIVLFRHYIEQKSINQAMKVLTTWLTTDPSSVSARILQASVYHQVGRGDAAAAILDRLFDDHPEDTEVITALESVYLQQKRVGRFVEKLEAQLRENPGNYPVVEHLVRIYNAQKKTDEIARVLEATRRAIADDPDLLYYLAGLHARIDQKEQGERLLQRVVELDPKHAPASNDLGYQWADEGRHLDEAEDLIRIAVETEPDNQSYLDSLGWVLYKRGKFEEAREFLDRALAPASRPDPVVLDHMGDVLYRLQKPDEAVKLWKRSMQRLDETRSNRQDLRDLRDQLNRKLGQREKGEPVEVAPIVESVTD